jgi:hypothetical protein
LAETIKSKKDCSPKPNCYEYDVPDLSAHLKNIESQVGTLNKIENKVGMMHALQPKLKDLLSDINEITDFSSLKEAKKGGAEIRKTLDALSPSSKKGSDELDADIELKSLKNQA